jgi:hypothetical protein
MKCHIWRPVVSPAFGRRWRTIGRTRELFTAMIAERLCKFLLLGIYFLGDFLILHEQAVNE